MVKPKKHLGQHFLTDPNIAEKIVLGLGDDDLKVLEIGPGTGVLTQYLIEKYKKDLYAIEIDSESYLYLQNKYPSLGDRLLNKDFLKINLKDYFDSEFSIIGNFPYNISSQIFFKVLENKDIVKNVVCMIQKEVANRIRSNHGNKTYGILSVFLQAYYDIDLLFNVKPGVFNPPPKVDSSVIRLRRNDRNKLDCDEKLFFRIVKTGFNQRRKTLRNSLKSIISDIGIDEEIFKKRPEQLSVDEFVELTNIVEYRM
ncbi:MAG: 16S rRNA (adenine(1518)-N(6)/adenine(1519)-N(6))-dimethyltransferase RsmA [Bacteroidota bacterium]|nr:16S rRNA (adenine(1518)-N(6)/adenine(1519)-N(6))-dimethyltransferase RsmA [Bacteroidota bacterium]